MRNRKFSFPVNTLCGSNYSNFRKVTAGHPIDRKMMFFLTGLSSLFLGVSAHFAEKRTLKKLKKITLDKPPVFIIGFWRSGTTLLHNLLCNDPDAAYVSTFQGVFPHHTPASEWWLKVLASPLLPRKRPADGVKLDFDMPQEEEIALGNLQSLSFYHFMYFPADIERLIPRNLLLRDVSEEELGQWKNAYIQLIKTAMLKTGGHRFISKNPPNAFRIPLLLEMFPGARFINIFREREGTLNSFERFLTGVIQGIGMQRYDKKKFRESLERLYDLYLEHYHRDKALIPPEHLIEMQYQELLDDPYGISDMIFRRFDPEHRKKALENVRLFLSKMDEFYDNRKK